MMLEARQCIWPAATPFHAQTSLLLKWNYSLPKEVSSRTHFAGMLMGLCRRLPFHQFSACWTESHRRCSRVMLIGRVNQFDLARLLCKVKLGTCQKGKSRVLMQITRESRTNMSFASLQQRLSFRYIYIYMALESYFRQAMGMLRMQRVIVDLLSYMKFRFWHVILKWVAA